MAKPISDRCLGNGVYASYDGYFLWLDLRDQETDDGRMCRIGFDPEALTELDEYRQHIQSVRQKLDNRNTEVLEMRSDFERLLTRAEAMQALRIGPTKLWTLMRTKRLKPIYISRRKLVFRASEIERFLRVCEREGRPEKDDAATA